MEYWQIAVGALGDSRSNSVRLRFYGGGVYNGCIYNKIHGFASFRCLRMVSCFGLNFA